MHARALAALALLLPASARASVIVVDVAFGPGADVHQIHQAVALASPGDTILVRDGVYQPFEVSQGVSIVADHDEAAVVLGPVRAHDVPAGQSLRLRGLTVAYGAGSTPAVPLTLEHCAGAVVLDSCALGGFTQVLPQTAVHVDDCDAAILSHCILQGGSGFNAFNDGSGFKTTAGSDGLHVDGGAFVTLLGCIAQGGIGGSDPLGTAAPGSAGGQGLQLTAGTLFVSHSTLAGGAGGWDDGEAAHGGNGGDGLVISGPGAAQLHDSQLLGGDAGSAGASGTPGLPGAPSSACCGGSITGLSGFGRDVIASSPVREGGTVTLHLDGLPAEQALLLVSADVGALKVPAFHGVLVAQPVLLIVPLSLDLGGHLTLPATVPELGPGVEAVNLLVQGLFGPYDTTLSSVAALTLLDGQF